MHCNDKTVTKQHASQLRTNPILIISHFAFYPNKIIIFVKNIINIVSTIETDKLYYWCSVVKLCLTLYGPMNCGKPDFPVLHHLLEFAQTHIHWVDDAIQYLLSTPSLPALIFPSTRVFSNESVLCISWAKILELQLQHQSFQWIFRVDFH